MKLAANPNRWWTRAAAHRDYLLEGCWWPLLGLGGLLAALLLPAWHIAVPSQQGSGSSAALAARGGDFHQLPAVRIGLAADAAGRLASITCNGRPARDVDDLREQIEAFRGSTAANASVEAVLDCDGRLRYQYTQRVIAALSTCPATDGRTMVPLVDRVEFSPRTN